MDADDTITFCENDLKSASFAAFEDMRKNGELCDFRITIQDRDITAHRVVVAAAIPYFRSIFTRDGDKEATLGDIDSKTFESLIDFAYSSRIKISGENVNQLLFASRFLRLDKVLEACVDFLSKRLDDNNVWQVRTLALSFDIEVLIEITNLYILRNTKALSESEEFLNIPHSHFVEILSKNDSNVASDKVLFDAVIDWVKFSPSKRQEILPELMGQIRMVDIPIDYLSEKAASEEVIRTSLTCRDMIDEVKHFHLFPQKTSMFPNLKVIPRKFNGLYSISQEGSTVSVSFCDFVNQMWHDVSTYEKCNDPVLHVVALFEKLYIFREKAINIFNTKTYEWNVILQPMDGNAFYATVVTAGNGIYGFGSLKRNFCRTVWYFDTEKNEWLEKSKMNEERCFSAALTLEGETQCVYVTGGLFHPNSVEKYCPSTNRCCKVASMLTPRSYLHAATSFDGKIYVCGESKKSEMYDPMVDQWTYVSSMNTERYFLSLVTHNGKIYALGGKERRQEGFIPVSTIEIYDPESNKWESSFLIPNGFKKAVLV